jgi:hypothetical protein
MEEARKELRWLIRNNKQRDIGKVVSLLRAHPALAHESFCQGVLSRPSGGHATPFIFFLRTRADVGILREVHGLYPGALGQPMKDGKLALHDACALQASDSVIEFLARSHPEAAAVQDGRGRLPLFYALSVRRPSEATIRLLLDLYPESLARKVKTYKATNYFQLALARAPTAETLEHVFRHLPPSVTKIGISDLYEDIFTMAHAKALGSILSRLEVFSFAPSCCTLPGFLELITHLNVNHSIQALHLDIPYLLPKDAEPLAKKHKQSLRLKQQSTSPAELTDEELVEALVLALGTCGELKKLALSCKGSFKLASKAIVYLLSRTALQSLTVLGCSYNMTDTAAICAALENNDSMKSLCIPSCTNDEAQQKCFVKLLEHKNTTLEAVTVASSGTDCEPAEKILYCTKLNQHGRHTIRDPAADKSQLVKCLASSAEPSVQYGLLLEAPALWCRPQNTHSCTTSVALIKYQ